MEQKEMIHLEGSPWFWKIFGGAILGLIGVLLIGYLSQINHNSEQAIQDLRGDIRELRQIIEMQKSIIETGKQKDAALDATDIAIKEDIKGLKEWNREISKQLTDLREKMAAKKP